MTSRLLFNKPTPPPAPPRPKKSQPGWFSQTLRQFGQMNGRTYMGFGIVLILAAIYLIFFVNWAGGPPAQGTYVLMPPTMPMRATRHVRKPPAVFPVTFFLDRGYEVTNIKAIPTIDINLNPDPAPVWVLQAKDSKQPVKLQMFKYGQRLPGMAPPADLKRPDKLLPDRPYRLILETKQGQQVVINFQTKPYAKPPAPPSTRTMLTPLRRNPVQTK